MKTTQQWWDEVSNDEEKMIDWLKDQHHGEVTAAKRISEIAARFKLEEWQQKQISQVVADEMKHSIWVGWLLKKRGIGTYDLHKEERYWNQTLPAVDEIDTFEYFCAVAHHAEVMRLDRIRLLAADKRFDDIAKTFSDIIVDEKYHAKIFGVMSTPEDIERSRANHKNGMNAIGLVV